MKVPLLDLNAQYLNMKAELDGAVHAVLASQHFILGPEVERCEQAIAAYSQCSHGIGMSSGTDALLVCLMAEDIGPGDEVITSPYTFFATVGAIARLGATPVFVDIDPATYNLNVSQLAAKITNRTKAIIPVHLYGQSADMDPVMAIARTHNLLVIEDAAQSIGAEYGGRRSGSIGLYGCLSFFPSKNLGAAGDAGMVVTNDPERAAKVACLRAHGARPKYYHRLLGGNFRLDALQAAVVSAKFRHLDGWTAGRNRNAERYNRLFAESGLDVMNSRDWAASGRPPGALTGGPQLVLPSVVTDRHVFNQYVIRLSSRDALKAELQRQGVGTEVYYPVPMHLQDCFKDLGHREGDFPESEAAAKETLALPIYPELTDDQAAYVVASIRGFFQRAD
jgi:dTDP-4-amino-4,6-dideoxygalactose transaminase